jgi:hypothetical protein
VYPGEGLLTEPTAAARDLIVMLRTTTHPILYRQLFFLPLFLA